MIITKTTLAKYLTDYIEHESEASMTEDIFHRMKEILIDGFDAFESVYSVEITIASKGGQHEVSTGN